MGRKKKSFIISFALAALFTAITGCHGVSRIDADDSVNQKDILLQTGENGVTPHIGENGNWFIGDNDTGVSATGLKDFNDANITVGFGQPSNDCISDFYFDCETDTLYQQKDGKYVVISTMSPAINEYESANFLAYSNIEKHEHGVNIKFDDEKDGYFINGKATQTFTYNVYSDPYHFPTSLSSGSNYYFSVEKIVPGLSFNILYFDKGHFTYAYDAYGSGIFSIPKQATGLCVRMVFTQGYSYKNVIARFGIYNEFSFKRLIDFLTVVPPRPMLSIVDDDGNKKFHQYLLPLVQEKEIPISSAVITGWVGQGNSMSWDQISDCFINGVEILSHSHSHFSSEELDSMSVNQIQYDYQKSKNMLSSHGYACETLVFPFSSAFNEKCVKAAKNVFSYGFRAGTNKTNYCGKIDSYGFDRYNISEATTVKNMTDMVDKMISENTGYVVWMIHTSSNGFSGENAQRLSQAIDYCLSKEIDIVTTSTGIKVYMNPVGF